jgi:hypothetical protein
MQDVIETRKIGNLTVSLYYSDAAESPREWEEDSTFFGFHRRYSSPDEPPVRDPDTALLIATLRGNICLPVWFYDHSGTTYRAAESNPFSCPWDSGLFGFIYISRKAARERFGVSRLTAKTVERVKESLKSEVEAYSAWANGEVYGWSIEDADGDVIDACGGYIGDSDYALQEGIEAAKEILQTARDFDEDAIGAY